MFVGKINSISQNVGFKGYQHVKNSVGETIMRFNYPFDSNKETCEIQFFKVTPTDKYNYRVIEEPIAKIQLSPDGTEINLQDITNLDSDEAIAYKYVRKDKVTGKVISEGADTGVKIRPRGDEYGFRIHNDKTFREEKLANGTIRRYEDYVDPVSEYKYTLISRKGTTPIVQGAMYMGLPDSYKPGIKYRNFDDPNTGKIYYDRDAQIKAEGTIKTFSNALGGTFAGFEEAIPELRKQGYKMLLTTPIANGDNVSSHSYWNKNNMQISPTMGNAENFASFMRELYKNGMGYVYDGTFTSEGLEGIHFQNALRYGDRKSQAYYMFRMNGINDGPLVLGIIGENEENFRVNFINTPHIYEQKSDGSISIKPNPNYNPKMESYIETYDARKDVNELSVNSHDDTLMRYKFELTDRNLKELDSNITRINELNKKYNRNIKLDSTEGAKMVSQFSNFAIGKKTEGGFVTWDANTDMVKMNYHISGYDTKNLMAIPNRAQREYEKQMIERGAFEVQDMTIQAGKYWTEKVNDIQTIYTAQTIGRAKTVDAVNKLIKEGKLPAEASLNEETLNNILNGMYLLKPKGILDKESITVKSLMKLPLDTLEFAENTVGILSSSFFSNRATTEDTIGVSRYDLMKQNNPHLVDEYAGVYKKVNNLFSNELKDFAESVVKKANENSNEKLIDKNGDYTEYGEYVMELIGQDIAKYALLKSISGNSFRVKTLPNGEMTYDYDSIRKATSLKQLGINSYNPKDEALQLEQKLEKGLKKLNAEDISFVANAINKRLNGTDTYSFRLAEAMTNRAGLGLNWRLDAAKDVMDMDAVRNKENDFDDTWNEVIKFWSKFVQGVKSHNQNSYIVAEITDVPDLMKDTYGQFSTPYNGDTDLGRRFNGEPDAMAKFFNETGITSEAGYSYFFTDLLKVFAPEFEEGKYVSDSHDSFRNRFDLLLQTRSVDYLRNLYTFMGNHDKPRMIHGLAVDMGLFHSPLFYPYKDGAADFGDRRNHRLDVIRVMSGAKTMADVPIELRLNVDNNEYFRTVSSRAIAQSKLIMDAIDDLGTAIPSENAELIKNALIDLTNGNYLNKVNNPSMTKIGIKELSSVEEAVKEIIKLAQTNHNLRLTNSEQEALIRQTVAMANQMDLSDFLVHGDFDWSGPNEKVGAQNRKYLEEILGTSTDSMKYDLYTVQLARLVQKAYIESKRNPASRNAINEAVKDFVQKYDRSKVNEARAPYNKTESAEIAMKKNGYAARDIKTALEMAIKQAEFKSGKRIPNKETLINKIYQNATEPAVAKAAMIMEFLKGLPGMPTMYAGDELGMTGYEEKAKNVYLQNRNALPWEDLEKNDYRKTVRSAMTETLQDRMNPELSALNNGTPYAMDVIARGKTRDEINARLYEIQEALKGLDENTGAARVLKEEQKLLTRELAKIAYMMQSANGDMTVTLFNAGAVEFNNRFDYFKKYGLDSEEKRRRFFKENNIDSINPNNRYVPILPKSEVDAIMLGAGVAIPVGTIFLNSKVRDKAEYIVKEINGNLGIVRKDGKKIIMDGLTSKNGVMILKHIKKLTFKGKNPALYNQKYNIVSNPYKTEAKSIDGQNLSIVSK